MKRFLLSNSSLFKRIEKNNDTPVTPSIHTNNPNPTAVYANI